MARKRGRKIDGSCLEAGPVRHHTLPGSLVARIGNVARIFQEVSGRPAAEWAKDFQRDRDPEKEVAVWEAMAAAYSIFTKERGLTLEARREGNDPDQYEAKLRDCHERYCRNWKRD